MSSFLKSNPDLPNRPVRTVLLVVPSIQTSIHKNCIWLVGRECFGIVKIITMTSDTEVDNTIRHLLDFLQFHISRVERTGFQTGYVGSHPCENNCADTFVA
jgi:hypothetical protein